MPIQLISALAIPALWALAGLLAGALPAVRTARVLRQRIGSAALALVLAGVATIARAVSVGGDRWFVVRNVGLLAMTAAALAITLPRLARVRAASRGFAAAGPGTPVPPSLQAAAGHPLVAAPVQLCAYGSVVVLVALPLPIGSTTFVLTLLVAAVLTANRHVTRHRRLVAGAIRPSHGSAALALLNVEQLQDRPGRLEPAVQPARRWRGALRRQLQQQAAE